MAVITVYDPLASDFESAAGWSGAGHPSWWDTQANMPPGDGFDASSEVATLEAYAVEDNVSIAGVNWQAYSIEGEGFNSPFYGDPVFTPALLDFGSVTSEKVVTFTVYNASILPKILAIPDVTPVAGVTLSSGTALPFVLGSLATVTMTVTVAMIGASSIAGSFQIYVGGDEFLLPFVGVRSLSFPFIVSGRGPVVEKISYLTAVSQSLNGTETRYGLCTDPRVTIEAEYTCLEMDAVRLREVLSSWMAKTFDVYQWQEETRLIAAAAAGATTIQVPTVDMPWQVGETIVLYQDTETYEVVEVSAIGTDALTLAAPLISAWNPFATVLPRLTMRLKADVNLTELTPYIYVFNAVWESDPQAQGVWSPVASPAITYKGLEVFPFEHNWRENRNTTIRQTSGFIDQGFGAVSLGYQSPSSPLGFDFLLFAEDRQKIRRVREFLQRRKGRLVPFYLPSGRADMVATRGMDLADQYFYVAYRPENALVFAQGTHRNVVVYLANGTRLYLTMIDQVYIPGSNETRFRVETPFASSILMTDIKSISYMYLARLDSDQVQMSRHTPDVAEVTMPCLVLREEGL